jgi:hypothetical protein
MDIQETKEVLACLPKDRTLYNYCRDYYAVELLQSVARRYPTIQGLKRSSFGRLLDKPSISSLLGGCGDGVVSESVLASYWLEPGTTYLITVGSWGSRHHRYNQTSRPGFNLVLRLNFNNQHDQFYQKTIRPDFDGALNRSGHPMLYRDERTYFRETMAWARLDVDLDSGEVLIEEIQSDWVRDVAWIGKRLKRYTSEESRFACYGFDTTVADAYRYLQFVEPQLKEWSQAMLSATLNFLLVELGVGDIWFHTWETGNCLKQIDSDSAPPKSLYTRLPKQFCFELTDQMPGFLNNKSTNRRLRRKKVTPAFYKLEI